jgi:hypothetical protein
MGYPSMNTKATVLCLVSALRNLDSGSERWFREAGSGGGHAGTAGQSTTPGQTTSPGNHESSLGHRCADSRHCCAHTGYPSADTRNCQSQPWNGSQHQWLYTAIAERHAGHNFTGVGNSWSDHPATRAAGAQRSATKQSATKQWHEWEPDGATFELVESRTRSSVQGVPLFCPNNFGTPATRCRMTRTTCSTYAAEPGF